MSKVIAITGACGFTGQYVAREFERQGYEILRLSSSKTPGEAGRFVYCELTCKDSIYCALSDHKIEGIIHLAAESFVANQQLERFYAVNTIGTTNLLEVLLQMNQPLSKIVISSSANVYGNNSQPALTESCEPSPVNHYGASKLAMEYLAMHWQARLPIIITRPFNYTGHGQSDRFLIPKIVNHFKSRTKQIELGNLDIERDFSDVRDIAKCYFNLFKSNAQSEIVNLCSGRAISLKSIISHIESISGHSIEVISNQSFVRDNEIAYLCGSNKKLFEITGFKPELNIFNTIESMFFS